MRKICQFAGERERKKMFFIVACSVVGFLAFYFTRSSKEMPRSWSQLKAEILWQYLGIRGLIEDYYLRNYNQVGELVSQLSLGNAFDILFEMFFLIVSICRFNVTELFPQPGRVAVITGGNRGIGADVVEKLLECEINVIMGEFFLLCYTCSMSGILGPDKFN